jgi:hypothetical protein
MRGIGEAVRAARAKIDEALAIISEADALANGTHRRAAATAAATVTPIATTTTGRPRGRPAAAATAASAPQKTSVAQLLQRRKGGMRREAIAAAMGLSLGLTTAALNRALRAGHVSEEHGLYRWVEPAAENARQGNGRETASEESAAAAA